MKTSPENWIMQPDSPGYWWMWEPEELGHQLALVHRGVDGLRVFLFGGDEDGHEVSEWTDARWHKADIEILSFV